MKWMTLAPTAFFLALGLAASAALAQSTGQGAIAVRNAAIYAQAEGDAVEYQLAQNDVVAGYTSLGRVLHTYAFENSNGRVHIAYLPNQTQPGFRTAWMNPDDLKTFTYDCNCSTAFHGLKIDACSPFAGSLLRLKWNNCFVQSRDKELAELQSGGAVQSAAVVTPAPEADVGDKSLSADDIARLTGGPSGGDGGNGGGQDSPKPSKSLTNKDVIALVKAGLGEKVVLDKIRTSAGDKLDTSTDALIRLKKAGVSSAVIDAIVKRAGN